MADPFVLSVDYKGEALDYEVQLIQRGYTHVYKLWIGQVEVYFEPDEEDIYRVIRMPGQDQKMLERIDKGLLFAIQQQLESMRT